MGLGIMKETGIVEMTKKNNGVGCICHDIEPVNFVNVRIEGPETVRVTTTNLYSISIIGGPSVTGGFNVAAWNGTIRPADNSSKLMFASSDSSFELTHTLPKNFDNNIVSWSFYYTSPPYAYTDTLYSAGNSTNGDLDPLYGDHWNFGENFIIHVVDSNTGINEEYMPPFFYLEQNYPNPFNPKTDLRFGVGGLSRITLKVYDILGKEVDILVNEVKEPGWYTVRWDASNKPSGVYYCRLSAGSYTETKKLLLIR